MNEEKKTTNAAELSDEQADQVAGGAGDEMVLIHKPPKEPPRPLG